MPILGEIRQRTQFQGWLMLGPAWVPLGPMLGTPVTPSQKGTSRPQQQRSPDCSAPKGSRFCEKRLQSCVLLSHVSGQDLLLQRDCLGKRRDWPLSQPRNPRVVLSCIQSISALKSRKGCDIRDPRLAATFQVSSSPAQPPLAPLTWLQLANAAI